MRPVVLTVLLASACLAQVDERCPGTALERGPTPLTRFDALKKVAQSEDYYGKLTFQLTVTDTGSIRDVKVTSPPQFVDSAKIQAEIGKLRFCPAVRFSRYVETSARFEIDLRRL